MVRHSFRLIKKARLEKEATLEDRTKESVRYVNPFSLMYKVGIHFSKSIFMTMCIVVQHAFFVGNHCRNINM